MPTQMQEIIASINKSWPKDYIIRYLYIKLAPFFERDLSYFLAPKEEKLKIYAAGFYDHGTKVVCSTLADFYVRLFQEFNINCRKIIAIERDIPLFALIVEGDFGWYYLDPLKDLFPNQYGLRPTEFGILLSHKNSTLHNYPELIALDKNYIREIDKDLNLPPNGEYLDEFFYRLHLDITERNTAKKILGAGEHLDRVEMMKRKIIFMNDRLINLGNVPGLYERYQLYQFLTVQIFNRFERKFISSYFFDNEDESVSINLKIEPKDNGEGIYYEENRDDDGQFTLVRKNRNNNYIL